MGIKLKSLWPNMTGIWFLQPEGLAYSSPGQRPGEPNQTRIQALKGRNNSRRIDDLCRPYRAFKAPCTFPQGVALG